MDIMIEFILGLIGTLGGFISIFIMIWFCASTIRFHRAGRFVMSAKVSCYGTALLYYLSIPAVIYPGTAHPEKFALPLMFVMLCSLIAMLIRVSFNRWTMLLHIPARIILVLVFLFATHAVVSCAFPTPMR